MRIDVATAHENRPKSIIARVREDSDADAIATAVADLDADAAVAYRVVDDEDEPALGVREEPTVDAKGKPVTGIGAWQFTTAGKLEGMKAAAIVKGDAPKAKAKAKR